MAGTAVRNLNNGSPNLFVQNLNLEVDNNFNNFGEGNFNSRNQSDEELNMESKISPISNSKNWSKRDDFINKLRLGEMIEF